MHTPRLRMPISGSNASTVIDSTFVLRTDPELYCKRLKWDTSCSYASSSTRRVIASHKVCCTAHLSVIAIGQ